jgi:thiamine biosynthesis lipoprotein
VRHPAKLANVSRRWAIVALILAGMAPLAVERASGEEASELGELAVRERRLGAMGTDLQLKVRGRGGAALDAALDAAEAEMRRVEDLMTDWRPSPLTTLNAAAGKGPQAVDRELAAIVSRALEMGRLTGGAFDPSYAEVGALWDFKSKPPRVPSPEQVARALERIGYQRIRVDPENSTVDLPAGMRIGLGGIAKGYGVDRAMAVLRARGVEHALVNAGGDLKALGFDGPVPWDIAIKHPRDRERVIAVLRVSNTALVTSGDYERFFEHAGRRFHHILDPRTGYPSTGAMSATVVAPSAEFADALATALCVMGSDSGLALIESLPRVEAILVSMDGRVHASAGLRTSLR